MADVSQTEIWSDIEAMIPAADHVVVAGWALECAGRVVPVFQRSAPGDHRVAAALEFVEQWCAGRCSEDEERHAAIIAAHNAARASPDRTGARAAARAAAQAAATTQNAEHAIGVAMYACMAVRDAAVPDGPADVPGAAVERLWQRDRLAQLMGRGLPPPLTEAQHGAAAPEQTADRDHGDGDGAR